MENKHPSILHSKCDGTFQAILHNPIIYVAVGDVYRFEATATDGTNITLDWDMELNSTISNTYLGLFSTGELNYFFER